MALVIEYAAFLASVFMSCALRMVSRTIRAKPLIHKAVKLLDRGKRKVPPGLPVIGPWDSLSNLVVRINGLNPGMHTLQGTNCYLVGDGKKRILIDTGEGVAGFVELFLDVMKEVGCEGLDAILLTHWHADHVGGVKDIQKALKGYDIPVLKRASPRQECFDYAPINDGQIFRTSGASLEAVYTPGHTEDHVAFVLREEKNAPGRVQRFCIEFAGGARVRLGRTECKLQFDRRALAYSRTLMALITGDMILGCGTAIFEDFTSYMASLQRVLDMSPKCGGGFSRLYCGHGPVVNDAEAKIRFYICHREEREAQIMDALKGACERPLSSWQITRRVYGHLPIPILVSAHYNVLHHLSKLTYEGRTETDWVPCSYRLSRRAPRHVAR